MFETDIISICFSSPGGWDSSAGFPDRLPPSSERASPRGKRKRRGGNDSNYGFFLVFLQEEGSTPFGNKNKDLIHRVAHMARPNSNYNGSCFLAMFLPPPLLLSLLLLQLILLLAVTKPYTFSTNNFPSRRRSTFSTRNEKTFIPSLLSRLPLACPFPLD